MSSLTHVDNYRTAYSPQQKHADVKNVFVIKLQVKYGSCRCEKKILDVHTFLSCDSTEVKLTMSAALLPATIAKDVDKM